jgi:hypothetical protein
VHGRAFIQVCLLDKPFDEDVLGDTDMGVMYVSENNDFQITTMCWPLTHVKLKGGCLGDCKLRYTKHLQKKKVQIVRKKYKKMLATLITKD